MEDTTESLLRAELLSKRKARRLKSLGSLLIIGGIFYAAVAQKPEASIPILIGFVLFIWGRFLE